jgi:flagellar motility protein MotE (MotC chaperone)
METTYFVLGVLTVVAVIVAGVITWGLLTINKQQTQIKNLQEEIQSMMRTISTEMDYTSRRIDNERRNIYDEIANRNNDIQKQLEYALREIQESEEKSSRYTDKRIDKLIDTYFDIKKNKDLLKG